jgi:hypothetical protein
MAGFILFVATLVLGILVLVGGLRWIREQGRVSDGRPGVEPLQLERIETALSALEARLDDLQDQQRFLERLLAERPEPRRLSGADSPSQDATTGGILFDTDEGER